MPRELGGGGHVVHDRVAQQDEHGARDAVRLDAAEREHEGAARQGWQGRAAGALALEAAELLPAGRARPVDLQARQSRYVHIYELARTHSSFLPRCYG